MAFFTEKSYYLLFLATILIAVFTIGLSLVFGMLIALAVTQPLRGRGVYRKQQIITLFGEDRNKIFKPHEVRAQKEIHRSPQYQPVYRCVERGRLPRRNGVLYQKLR